MEPTPDRIIRLYLSAEDLGLIQRATTRAMARARRARRRYHPRGSVGMRQYQEAQHELCEQLLPTGRWKRVEHQGFYTLVSLDERVAIATGSGEFAGLASPLVFGGVDEDSHRQHAIETNASILPQPSLFNIPEPVRRPDPITFFVVMAQDHYRMRAEIQYGVNAPQGRMSAVERFTLLDQAGERPAARREASPTSQPDAVKVEVEIEWLPVSQLKRDRRDDKA